MTNSLLLSPPLPRLSLHFIFGYYISLSPFSPSTPSLLLSLPQASLSISLSLFITSFSACGLFFKQLSTVISDFSAKVSPLTTVPPALLHAHVPTFRKCTMVSIIEHEEDLQCSTPHCFSLCSLTLISGSFIWKASLSLRFCPCRWWCISQMRMTALQSSCIPSIAETIFQRRHHLEHLYCRVSEGHMDICSFSTAQLIKR